MSLEGEVRRAAETDRVLAALTTLERRATAQGVAVGQVEDVAQEAKATAQAALDATESSSGTVQGDAGEPGFRIARSWDQAVRQLNAGVATIIDAALVANQTSHVRASVPLKFSPRGSLDLREAVPATLDCPILNPADRHIFHGVKIVETYPERWSVQNRTLLRGDFGGDPTRRAEWWGASPHSNPNYASKEQAEANNHAIAAAALSQSVITRPVVVCLGAGDFPFCRPIRLDGLRAHLRGAAGLQSATRLWANNYSWSFDCAHRIKTPEFPEGTTPMVQIGWERQPTRNQDEGFQSGVLDVTLIGPTTNRDGFVSGIMWESGWQEGGRIRNVCIQIFSGIGIGGPRQKHIRHNTPDGSYYPPQVNSVSLDDLWLFSARGERAIGMSVFGYNYRIGGGGTVTVDQQARDDAGNRIGSINHAILAGAAGAGQWSNIHVETAAAPGIKHAAICCPQKGTSMDRLIFDGIVNHPGQPYHPSAQRRALLLQNDRGGYACRSIRMNLSHKSGGVAIEDEFTGRKSSGWDNSVHNGPWVADYNRSKTGGRAFVTSSDPQLQLIP